jgi:hypothetical protein
VGLRSIPRDQLSYSHKGAFGNREVPKIGQGGADVEFAARPPDRPPCKQVRPPLAPASPWDPPPHFILSCQQALPGRHIHTEVV